MDALLVIGWFVWVVFAIALVFAIVGFRGLVQMFPEGRRFWHLPAQLASLAFFAAAVLCHPWQ